MTTLRQLEKERTQADARLAELRHLDIQRRRELQTAHDVAGAVTSATEPRDLARALADVEALAIIVTAVKREVGEETQRRRRTERRLTELRERRWLPTSVNWSASARSAIS